MARDSRKVDFPGPFSPTRIVTGASKSIRCREAIEGTSKGKPLPSTSPRTSTADSWISWVAVFSAHPSVCHGIDKAEAIGAHPIGNARRDLRGLESHVRAPGCPQVLLASRGMCLAQWYRISGHHVPVAGEPTAPQRRQRLQHLRGVVTGDRRRVGTPKIREVASNDHTALCERHR
jgi:hypothetical protein